VPITLLPLIASVAPSGIVITWVLMIHSVAAPS